MIARVALMLLVLGGASLFAQASAKWERCPIATRLPADSNWMEDIGQRARFDIHQCGGDFLVLAAFEPRKSSPSLVYEIGDPSLVSLSHRFNVLAIQTVGGASDHVFVFMFKTGKPELALKTATKDLIQVRFEANAFVVLVPPTTYPDSDGKFPTPPPLKRYNFSLEH